MLIDEVSLINILQIIDLIQKDRRVSAIV